MRVKPSVDVGVLPSLNVDDQAVPVKNDFSAPLLGKTLFRRSAFESLFKLGKISFATKLHLSCRHVGVSCGSNADLSCGINVGKRVGQNSIIVHRVRVVPRATLAMRSHCRKGVSGSCLRLLPGFTLRCSFTQGEKGICTAIDGNCHSKNCGIRVFSSLLRSDLGGSVVQRDGRTVVPGIPSTCGRLINGCFPSTKRGPSTGSTAICGPRRA